MPAATEAFTSAGTIIAIAVDLSPATEDDAGYSALSYNTISEITNAGEFGRQYNLVTHLRLDERRTVKRKGSFNDGAMTLQLARVTSNPGQADLVTALDSDLNSSFQCTLQDGTNVFFMGQVLSYTTNIGGVDQITGSTVQIEITSDILEVAPV